jgi:phage FluMu protein Com
MAISIHCPGCGKKLNAPDSAAGRKARCPHCKTVVTLPMMGAPQEDEVLDAEPVAAPPPPYPGVGIANEPESDEYGLADDIPMANQPPPLPVGGGGATRGPGLPPEPPRRPCPVCGEMIPLAAVQCRFCNTLFDSSLKGAGRASHATSTSQNAIWSLVCGIFGFVCFGLILGIVAINLSRKAKEEIAFSNGTVGGSGMATAGMVLGIIDIIAWAILIFGKAAASR